MESRRTCPVRAYEVGTSSRPRPKSPQRRKSGSRFRVSRESGGHVDCSVHHSSNTMNDYGRRIVIDMDFEAAVGAVSRAIREEGLQTLARIDVRDHFWR